MGNETLLTRRGFLGLAGGTSVGLATWGLRQRQAYGSEAPLSAEASSAGQWEVAREPFKAACLQFNPVLRELDENISGLCDALEEVLSQGVRLVVCPEMCTSGYTYTSRDDIAPFVDTIPGKATEAVGALCAAHDAYVVFGMAEDDGGIYYNSAVLVGPEGVVGTYRKTHPVGSDQLWDAWGDLGFPTYDTELGKISMNICMDSAYWESARLSALGGANILCFPTNSSGQAVAHLEARAVENGMYVVSANRSNSDDTFHMCGGSAIWSPLGEKIVECDVSKTDEVNGPTYVIGEIDPALYDNENRRRMAGRRPELYQDVLLKVAPLDDRASTEGVDVTALALQYEPQATVKETEDVIRRLVRDHGGDADIVVLPELSLTGVVDTPTETLVESVSFAAELAAETDAYVVIGAIEQDGDDFYNTAAIVSSAGEVKGTYRKTHLGETDGWAKPGDAIPVFELEGIGRLGVLIGDDVCFPEAAGVLEVNRVDVIVNPSAWYGQYGAYIMYNKAISANPFPDNAMVLWDSVSESAMAYVITANFVGGDRGYRGASALNVLDPLYATDRQSTASSDQQEAFAASFTTVHPEGDYLQKYMAYSRQTVFYKPIVAHES